jgi:nucleoside-diphosphate-sugar epimerase
MSLATKTCALTGAGGFVGSRLKRYLEAAGWRVIPWTRKPEPGSNAVPFRLGQQVDPGLLRETAALVHCAYDFGPRSWEEINAVNVAGSQKLLEAARQAGVGSVVLISTISAFPGCRSLYGKAKLEIESAAQSVGAYVIRPGLVYSDNPGGMFGRLVAQARGPRFIPIMWGGKQTQYLVHDEDLGKLVLGCLEARVSELAEPFTIAHEQGWELKDILGQIALALGKRPTFVPVPWQCVWLALKSLELAGVRTNFRSDSLISMVYQNPHPEFTPAKALGFECRPFKLTPGMLGT